MEKGMPVKVKPKKAKAIGQKSALVLDEKQVIVTSFGKGREAVLEKRIERRGEGAAVVEDYHSSFSLSLTDRFPFTVSKGGGNQAQVFVEPPEEKNMLGKKAGIEQKYFGARYADNIHIQMAYQAMDVKKIQAYYIGYTVQIVNALIARAVGKGEKDCLGMFAGPQPYENARLAYLLCRYKVVGDAAEGRQFPIDPSTFNDRKVQKSPEEKKAIQALFDSRDKQTNFKTGVARCLTEKYEKRKYFDNAAENYRAAQALAEYSFYFSDVFSAADGDRVRTVYHLLWALNFVRNAAFHDQSRNEYIYSLSELGKMPEEVQSTLQSLFANKYSSVCGKFVSTNGVNLSVLAGIFAAEDREELVCSYFRFLILKDADNLGVSVRRLREVLLDTRYPDLRGKGFDSVRPKLYGILDYLIWRILSGDGDLCGGLIEKLRACTTEEAKETVYAAAADTVGGRLRGMVDFSALAGRILHQPQADTLEQKDELQAALNRKLGTEKPLSCFSLILFAVCLFLDGKEINMLLCALIEKLENIAAFRRTAAAICGEEAAARDFCFITQYDVFNADGIPEELRRIRSLVRMMKGKKATSTQEAKVKKLLYTDALELLGCDTGDGNTVEELLCLSVTGRSPKHSFRNFLINNVLCSRRFHYVVRLLPPKEARKIMQNPALVGLALRDIPDTQIVRYAKSVGIPAEDSTDPAGLREQLRDRCVRLDYSQFTCVQNAKENEEKQRYIAILGLYLTLLYLIVKTLLTVNARYTIAIGILERDMHLFGVQEKEAYLEVAEGFYREKRLSDHRSRKNPSVLDIYRANREQFSPDLFRIYRNCIVHLAGLQRMPAYCGEIRKAESWFDLYHAFLQRAMRDMGADLPDLRGVKPETYLQYSTGSRDLIRLLNLPFAYNAARYLNLSSENLFTRSFGC